MTIHNEMLSYRSRCSIFDTHGASPSRKRFRYLRQPNYRRFPTPVSLLACTSMFQMNSTIRQTTRIHQSHRIRQPRHVVTSPSATPNAWTRWECDSSIATNRPEVSICLFLSYTDLRERIRSRETPWHKVEAIYAETRLVIIARPERIALVIDAFFARCSRLSKRETRRDAQRDKCLRSRASHGRNYTGQGRGTGDDTMYQEN